MIYELSFALIGGVNLGLEKYWNVIENIMKKYPDATWRKITDWKHKRGMYVIEIE